MILPHDATYVFLFAHPDDDAFISGTMRFLIEQGARVHGVWLTSGDYFGKGDIRERELSRAASVLGLRNSHVHLLRFPDLGLAGLLDQASDAVSELLARIRPDKIFATAYEGGHPDHDSVNFLAYEGRLRAGLQSELYEFPLYSAAGKVYHFRWLINSFPAGDTTVLHMPLPDSAIRCRLRVLRAYPSQWVFMVPLRLATSRSRLRRIGEQFRPCPVDRDHTVRPHSGKLSYERWINSFMKVGFAEFRTAVIHARAASSGRDAACRQI
jgi:LmbE family N-acetylglucosaminyl deacetylase